MEGIGVMASLDADAEIHLFFRVPGGLPTGTAKLSLVTLGYTDSGNLIFNPKWKSVALEENIDLAASSLNAEGSTTQTRTGGSDDHQLKEVKIVLDADTIVAGEYILMRLVLESASWTYAGRAIIIPSIIWE
jgi:hypothetical protein